MSRSPATTRLATHEVTNQPTAFGDRNLYVSDVALRSAVQREAGDWLDTRLADLGVEAGSAQMLEWGHLANRHLPEHVPFDRFGARLDEARFHPAYHHLMDTAMRHRIHDLAWTEPGPAPHMAHSAMMTVFTQAEAGVMCPINMTYAVVPVLRAHLDSGKPWLDRLIGGTYDAPLAPIGGKKGITMGMAMTEKQGGSDVRANSTRAEPAGEMWRLTGHKWFCSAPMSDGFLTLAYTDEGLTCFLVPRVLPDGERNAIHVMRLKDKLGNKSNASSEIEYHGALAWKMGEEGRGVNTIIDMVHHTRLGTISSVLGIMRAALTQAAHHVSHRRAFQKTLIDQPLMARVIADLQVEYEAAAALVMHIAARFDATTPEMRAYTRLAVALGKYLLTKRCANFVYECMECLGGAGYVEEGPLPRLYREAPLNAIWEGSGNVIALDVMRTLHKEPAALEVYFATISEAAGQSSTLGAAVGDLKQALVSGQLAEGDGRYIAERMAVLLQAAILAENAPAAVADAFVATRLNGQGWLTFGAQSARIDETAVVARVFS